MVKVTIISAEPDVRAQMTDLLNAGGMVVDRAVPTVREVPELGWSATVAIIDLAANADFHVLLPGTSRIIVLCGPDHLPDIVTAVRSGVHAFLTREVDGAELMLAVRAAVARGLYISSQLLPRLVPPGGFDVPTDREVLTVREIETLRWITRGLTHRQVARQMGVTEETVNTYAKRIRRKLRVGNKAELTRRALELGYASYEPFE